MVFSMFIFYLLSTLENSPHTSCSEADLRIRLTDIDLVFYGSCTKNPAGDKICFAICKNRDHIFKEIKHVSRIDIVCKVDGWYYITYTDSSSWGYSYVDEIEHMLGLTEVDNLVCSGK